jgi:RNA polymerase sigma-70 factor, ECF subfamily
VSSSLPSPGFPSVVLESGAVADRAEARAELERTLSALAGPVRRWLLGILGPRADLDDATQDALIELARALPSFRGEAKLTTFAYRITIRVAYRYFERRQHAQVDDRLPSQEADPEDRAMHRHALARIHRLMTRLHPNQRVVFALCALEGMTDIEAAEALELSPTAVRSRLHRARTEIARLVAHDEVLAPLARRRSR